jgi:hypothetical protein
MNLYEEIELQEKERMVDSLATENQMLQEPKTPTQEQIKELSIHLCFNCENDFPCNGHCYKCETEHWKKFKWQVKETIAEWEKIRGGDK